MIYKALKVNWLHHHTSTVEIAGSNPVNASKNYSINTQNKLRLWTSGLSRLSSPDENQVNNQQERVRIPSAPLIQGIEGELVTPLPCQGRVCGFESRRCLIDLLVFLNLTSLR